MTRDQYRMLALMGVFAGTLMVSAPSAHTEETAPGQNVPPVAAGHEDESKAEGRFKEADKNGDGMLDRDEMLDRHEEHVDTVIKESDKNGDGKLDRDEMKARREVMREKFKDRRDDRHEKMKEHHEKMKDHRDEMKEKIKEHRDEMKDKRDAKKEEKAQ